MVQCYDDWERLVEAVMHRELFRQLSLCDSLTSSPSTLSRDSSFSISSNTRDGVVPLDDVKLTLVDSLNHGKQIGSKKRRNPIWKGLSIFRVFSFKKDNGREEREIKWAQARRTIHGLRSVENEVSEIADLAKRRAETARLQELHTLKGHIESVLRAKGMDLDSIPRHYTI